MKKKEKTIARKLLIGILLLALGVPLTGCASGGEEETSKDAKEEEEDITLTVTLGEHEMGNTEVYAEYEATHPGIHIDVIPLSNNDTKLLSMIASGNPPDVIRCMAYDEIPVFVQRGILMPLDDYIAESDKIDLDNMYESANLCRFEGANRGTGALYGLPKDWCPIGLWINKDVFAEEGIPLPSETEPMTWEEFADLAKRLVKKDGEAVNRHGCITALPLSTLLEMYLNSNGSSLWTEDFSSTTLDAEETRGAVEYFKDLQEQAAIGSSLYPPTDTIGQSALLEDKTGMVLAGYWFIGGYGAANKSEETLSKLMFVPAPVGEKKASYCLDMVALGIFSESKHPKEAYELWEYLVTDEGSAGARAKIGLGLPASKSYFSYLPQATELQRQALGVVENYQLGTLDLTPKICPYITYASMTALFDQYYLPVLFGRAELEGALETIQSEAEILIQEGKELVGAE